MHRNRWNANYITMAALAGVVALVPVRAAFAQPAGAESKGEHGHRAGLVHAALALDSLTPAQRTAIEQLERTRHTAEVPVRQADAQVLTLLAQQVEQAAIDKNALAPSVTARESAAQAARAVDLDTVQKLHDLLTPAQRNQLVDGIEARFHGRDNGKGDDGPGEGHHGQGRLRQIAEKLGLTDQQKAQIMANLRAEHGAAPETAPEDHGARGKAWLDSFRGEAFHATQSGPNSHEQVGRMDRMEKLLTAAVPVLSPSQRAQLASHLRARAAHESHA